MKEHSYFERLRDLEETEPGLLARKNNTMRELQEVVRIKECVLLLDPERVLDESQRKRLFECLRSLKVDREAVENFITLYFVLDDLF